MKFIDLFAGIGGFRTGMEMNGHECVAFCEIDKYARQSYKAIYDTEGEEEWHDITQVSNDDFRSFRGRADVITGGFPCQAFSIAGKRRGFEDTRGTLFFEIARAIKEIEPSYALLENVKGLFSHDKGRTFGTIIQALDELGYVVEWGLFNSKFWGVPQNRERVFILATRKDIFRQPKLIDLLNRQTEVNTKLIDVLEDDVDEKYFLTKKQMERLTLNMENSKKGDDQIKLLGHRKGFATNSRTYSPDGITGTLDTSGGGGRELHVAIQPVLTPDRIEKRQNGRRFKEDGEPMFTLTSQDRHGIAIREATKQGYGIAMPGDSVNYQYPDSETRRGRVGKGIANTLEASGINQGIVIDENQDRHGEEIKCLNTKGENGKQPPQQDRIYSTDGLMTTISAELSGRFNIKKPGEYRIRKLTPLECWRLQGFTDEQFYKAKNDGVSDSQLYKQAGNSVTVNVIDAIARRLT